MKWGVEKIEPAINHILPTIACLWAVFIVERKIRLKSLSVHNAT